MLATAALSGTAQAQQRASFAVLPFENSGSYGQDKEIFEALALGIPAVLASSLDRHPGADAAEPGPVSQALAAAGLGPGGRIDAAGAARVGKATGSRFAVTGSFADFYGKFRVNARVVDAATGQIVEVVSNDDPELQDRAQLPAILKTVGDGIVAAAGLSPASPGGGPDLSTEAITDFSLGLLHESRGDRAKALDSYRKAVSAAPQFQEAHAGARRVSGS
jgi:TolB-like protein